MNIIYAKDNIRHNSIDIYTYASYFLRIDCGRAENHSLFGMCPKCFGNK